MFGEAERAEEEIEKEKKPEKKVVIIESEKLSKLITLAVVAIVIGAIALVVAAKK